MDRRRFLLTSLAGALAAPLAAWAQQAGKVHHIGFLPAGASEAHRRQLEALREGLRELGYVPDKTIVITAVWPETPSELPASAASLVGQKPEVIVAPASPAVSALKRLTGTIPIVFATAADPVGSGFVASLARPGGNITGLSQLNVDLSGKRVELLREAFASRKAVVLSLEAAVDDPGLLALTEKIRQETERRGAALGVDLRLLKVARVEELASAMGGLHPQRDGGLIILPTPLALSHARAIAELALKQKLPAISAFRIFAEDGGLMTYGVDLDDQLRRAATYVDRILKGARPGDLPVQQPSKFQLVINLKTAKALGLTIPPALLARADQVIE
jgi:putative ABC transport system substrate-binding protein